jgi:hypothetical protein
MGGAAPGVGAGAAASSGDSSTGGSEGGSATGGTALGGTAMSGNAMGGSAGSGGGSEGVGGAAGGPSCVAPPADGPPPYEPTYRIPLRVHKTRSDLSNDQLCAILVEVNQIWWSQAAICFEVETTNDDEAAEDGFDLFFERSAPFPNGVNANGVYSGRHQIYSLDRPSLGQAPNPVAVLASRTAAHELGHGLNLGHQNCGQACGDLLMTSGKRGFQLVTGAPASVDEHARARQRAATLALDDTTPAACGAPRVD